MNEYCTHLQSTLLFQIPFQLSPMSHVLHLLLSFFLSSVFFNPPSFLVLKPTSIPLFVLYHRRKAKRGEGGQPYTFSSFSSRSVQVFISSLHPLSPDILHFHFQCPPLSGFPARSLSLRVNYIANPFQ